MPRMTSLIATLAVVAALAAPAAAGEFLSDLEGFRAQVLEDRRALVTRYLELNESEAASFWPVYEAYQEEVEDFRRRRMNMVLDFLQNRGSHGRAESIALMREWLAMKQDWVRLEREWVGEFLSVLPARKALRYYQIENKIDALINAELAAIVPLAATEDES